MKYNTGKEEVTIPEGIELIDRFAFINNPSIKILHFPKSLTHIFFNAFTNSSLVSVELGKNLRYVGIEAFSFCKNLETVKFKGKRVIVDSWAFSECNNLKSVYFSGKAEISKNAFCGCDNLQYIRMKYAYKKSMQYLFLPKGAKIIAPKNSEVYKWCIEFNLPVEEEKVR